MGAKNRIRAFGGIGGITQEPAGLNVGAGGMGGNPFIQIVSAILNANELTKDVTLPVPVDLNKSIIIPVGGSQLVQSSTSNTGLSTIHATVQFVDASTIQIEREGTTTSDGFSQTYAVIEFPNAKSAQRGSTLTTSATGKSVTISEVDMAKSFAVVTVRSASTSIIDYSAKPIITTTTNLSITTDGTDTKYFEWQVMEFK